MSNVEKLLKEMDGVLDQLIDNAEKLHEISKKVIAEEELTALQSRQQELLTSLLSLDEACHQAGLSKSKKEYSKLNTSIQEKLNIFEQLNSSFVNNVVSSHGVIQFQGRKTQKPKK